MKDKLKRPLRAYAAYWTRALDFKTRCGRADFWLALGADLLVTALLWLAAGRLAGLGAAGAQAAGWLLDGFTLVSAVPTLAIGARRLHDIGRSGWWLLLAAVPAVGAFVLFVWWLGPGDPATNRFGAPRPV